MEISGRSRSQRFTQAENEPYYCAPAYKPSDIICPGSDTEETPEDTRRKRRRYEDAARRYVSGERPRLISAILRGPLDAGWVNPWRHRPRANQELDWWQPGSDTMLFTRENVMSRAGAYGLGYLTPKEALEWCKASARAELASQAANKTNSRPREPINVVKSSAVNTVKRNVGGRTLENTAESTSYDDEDQFVEQHAEEGVSLTSNYSGKLSGDQDGMGNKRGTKRHMDMNWLKGSYVSKRSRWDGPTHATPTPLGAVADREARGQRQLNGASTAPGRAENSYSCPRFDIDRRLNPAAPIHDYSRESSSPSLETGSRTLYRDQITAFHNRQVENLGQSYDELQDFPSTLISQVSKTKSQTSRRNSGDRFIGVLETERHITTPAGVLRTKNLREKTCPSTASSSHVHPSSEIDTNLEEEINFITEVAPSDRDLEKFVFRRKRFVQQEHPSEDIPKKAEEHEVDASTNEKSLPEPLHIHENAEFDSLEHESVYRGNTVQELSDRKTTRQVAVIPEISALTLGEGRGQDFVDAVKVAPSFSKHTLNMEYAAGSPNISPNRSSSLVPSSKKMNLKNRQSLRNPPSAGEKSSMPVQAGTGSPIHGLYIHSAFKSASVEPVMSQNPDDASTQSYNITPSYTEQTSDFPSQSDRKSPKLVRLKRFSFENSSSNLLISPIGQSRETFQPTLGLNLQAPEIAVHRSNVEHSAAVELEDYNAYMKGDLLESELSEHHYEPSDDEEQIQENVSDERHIIANHTVSLEHSGGSEHQTDVYQRGHDVVSDELHPYPDQADALAEGPNPLENVLEDEKSSSQNSTEQSEDVTRGSSPDDNAANLMGTTAEEIEAIVDEADHVDDDANSDQQQHHLIMLENPATTQSNKTFRSAEEVTKTNKFTSLVEQGTRKLDPGNQAAITDDELETELVPVSAKPIEEDNELEASQSQVAELKYVQSPFAQDTISIEKPVLGVQSKDDLDMACDTESESSWQGCGPQSPWLEGAEPQLSRVLIHQAENNVFNAALEDQKRDLFGSDDMVDTREIRIRRSISSSPEVREDEDIIIKLSGTFRSPSPSPSPSLLPQASLIEGIPTNTQQLVDAALENPWTSRLKEPSAKKTRKRVSFDHDSLDMADESQEPIRMRTGPASPPPPDEELLNEVIFGAGLTQATPFSSHFNVARKFTRIFPDTAHTPSKSSPRLSAQAEAFIAADKDGGSDTYEKKIDDTTPSRHLQPRSAGDENTRWQESQEECDGILHKHLPHEKTSQDERFNVNNTMSNFDMDEALGQMGDYLEDWSVEAELKRTHEMASNKERPASGARRQRLFGLV